MPVVSCPNMQNVRYSWRWEPPRSRTMLRPCVTVSQAIADVYRCAQVAIPTLGLMEIGTRPTSPAFALLISCSGYQALQGIGCVANAACVLLKIRQMATSYIPENTRRWRDHSPMAAEKPGLSSYAPQSANWGPQAGAGPWPGRIVSTHRPANRCETPM